MKYNDDLFYLSTSAYNNIISSTNLDEVILEKQNLLLKLLIKKFEEQLKMQDNIGDGITKIRFENGLWRESVLWEESQLGYKIIKELIYKDSFDSFASEYCMYLGDIKYEYDKLENAYYEVIWDYKSYFEQTKGYQYKKI